MRKKALLALLLVMTLALSSCALIVKDAEVDAKTEILRLGDQVVLKEEVQSSVDYQLYYMAAMYAQFGYNYDVTDPSSIQEARDSVISSLRRNMVLNAKAAELGLDQLSEEEETQVKADAESSLESDLESERSYLQSQNPELEGDALEEAVLKEIGGDLDAVRENYIKTQRDTLIRNKLREQTVKDVDVTDDEIQADFDSKVEADKEKYISDAGAWATAANRGTTTLYYTPAGVRRVKQILIKFTEDDSNALTEAKAAVTDAANAVTTEQNKVTAAQEIIDREDATEDEKAQATADLEEANKALEEANKALEEANAKVNEVTEAAFANIDSAADEVIAQLKDGADWDTLMAEKNEDPGMQAGAVTAETGYAVAAEGTSFDTAFVDAAMALANVGDVSDKVRSTAGYGYYIIKYIGDETEGAISLEGDVKQAIYDALLSDKQSSYYEETVTKWIEEAHVTENLGALND